MLRFVYSQKIQELLTLSTTAPALDGLKRSDKAGQPASYLINFKVRGHFVPGVTVYIQVFNAYKRLRVFYTSSNHR